MNLELHCGKKLHGIIVDLHVVEFKCGSKWCGAQAGVVVLHRFDLRTGKMVSTKRFKYPVSESTTERREHAASHPRTAIRSA